MPGLTWQSRCIKCNEMTVVKLNLLRHIEGLRDERLLLVHGMLDETVEIGQSWYLSQELINRGVLFTQMVRGF